MLCIAPEEGARGGTMGSPALNLPYVAVLHPDLVPNAT